MTRGTPARERAPAQRLGPARRTEKAHPAADLPASCFSPGVLRSPWNPPIIMTTSRLRDRDIAAVIKVARRGSHVIMKLFISYARVDKPLCKQIVQHLQDVHEVWYDRRLHAGQQWWNEIVTRLEWCEGFVYLLSPESVASEYCQREFDLALDGGKHIFPVLIQARTDVPDTLSHIHYADLSEGMEDIITLMNALTVAERQQRVHRPSPAERVRVPPTQPPVDVSPNTALAQAADAMEAEQFDNAVFILKQALDKKPKGRIERILKHMLGEAEEALERQMYLREASRDYAPIVELVNRAATRELGCAEFADFKQQFPDYDPENVASICTEIKQTKTQTPAKPTPTRSVRSRVLDLLPEPFAWIDIPAGRVDIKKHGEFDVAAFQIAKYPITNAQYAKFIEAGGYRKRKWWTDAGWERRSSDSWTEPRYWAGSRFNGREQPVVGVSWYEAVAFCLWLSDLTGEQIMLPTEDQWQRAAQGDDGRVYPWGDEWDCHRCNNSVDPCDSKCNNPCAKIRG